MRPTGPLMLLASLSLAACVEGGGGSVPVGADGVVPPASAAQACVSKAARLLKLPRDGVAVTRTLSYPEGEVVTLAVTGMGKVRCQVDVDGRIGDLVWIEGGPKAAAAAG